MPIIDAILPAAIESAPNPGPTERSSTIFRGAGNAPARNKTAKSVASWEVKLPVIIPEPPVIAELITGAVITTPSRTTANLFPILSEVALPNFWAPLVSNLKETAWPSVGSKDAYASIKFSPPTLDFFSNKYLTRFIRYNRISSYFFF